MRAGLVWRIIFGITDVTRIVEFAQSSTLYIHANVDATLSLVNTCAFRCVPRYYEKLFSYIFKDGAARP